MTKTYTEDDTYEKLQRSPFNKVLEEYKKFNLTADSGFDRMYLIESHGWAWIDFMLENARRRDEGLPHIK